MTDEQRDQRHHARMQRKKAIIDAKIQRATEERGILVILKGTGKGKSSSAFGMVARALGHDMQVGIVQFIKGKWQTGEEKLFANHPAVRFEVMGTGFTWDTQDRRADIAASEQSWSKAERMLADEHLSLVVLDEITYLFQYDYLPLEKLLTALSRRPAHQHVVITGRPCPDALEAVADTITEVRNQRHAFASGIKAQPGIDW
nr:cob(I)yrinic acid a,c-diamide adenosyltransferase [Motiliproteus sediminis]